MNDLQRVDLHDPAIKPTRSRARMGSKVTVCLLSALIVSAMIAWLSFIGWGIIEFLQWSSACIKNFWTTFF
jgi:hypothetical protein